MPNSSSADDGRIILFEDGGFVDLLPLVYWRTVFELRCGRKTLIDRLAHVLRQPIGGLWTRDWVCEIASERFQLPVNEPIRAGDVLINGRWLPSAPVEFPPGPAIGTKSGSPVYIVCDDKLSAELRPAFLLDRERVGELLTRRYCEEIDAELGRYPWDLVRRNADVLESDWNAADVELAGTVHRDATLIESQEIHIRQNARVDAGAVIDGSTGPVYVSDGAHVCSHAHIAGPAYIGPGSVVNPFAQLHGGVTIGPRCKVGGEIDACVFTGYSNKQHFGFLGHAYVGSWVNLGAGATNSDLKNTYGVVRAALNGQSVDTGLHFFGCILGDHCKIGIQQALPTGAVIGFGANVAVGGMLPKWTPSLTWLSDAGRSVADPQKLAAVAERVMQRRNVICTEADKRLFQEVALRMEHYEQPFETAGPQANATG